MIRSIGFLLASPRGVILSPGSLLFVASFLLGVWTLADHLGEAAREILKGLPWLQEWPGRLGAGKRESEVNLQCAAGHLRSIEELLESGQLPAKEDWLRLKSLEEPWGALCGDGVAELRSRGAPLLPTLKRLRSLAVTQREILLEGRSRTATAYAQAWACTGLVPAVGVFLESVLPNVSEHGLIWWSGVCVGTALGLGGAFWISRLADAARWGGLPASCRSWVLEAPVAGERILSLIRSGDPPDLAWTRAMSGLGRRAPELVEMWGAGLFAEGRQPRANPAELSYFRLGISMKRALQAGLLEGRGASERLETALDSVRVDFLASVHRETALLSTRALQPLFLFCAPAVIGLIGIGLGLCWKDALGVGW